MRIHLYVQTMAKASMRLRYYLPAWGFDICVRKIKVCGECAIYGMPKRAEVKSRPRVDEILRPTYRVREHNTAAEYSLPLLTKCEWQGKIHISHLATARVEDIVNRENDKEIQ